MPALGANPTPPDPSEELVDLIDRRGRVIGWAKRGEIRRRNLLHRGVGVLCRNPRGEIYVHRRTETKDVFPGMYDMFVGGVVLRGEGYVEAARREVAEELGIDAAEPLWIFDHLYLGERNRSLVAVYDVVWEGEIRHQEEEISWGTYLPFEELEAKLSQWPFVPDGLEIFHNLPPDYLRAD